MHAAPGAGEVVGGYVAVEEPCLVYVGQRGKEGPHEREELFWLHAPTSPGGKLLQRGAIHVFHYEVGGAVFLEEVARDHDLLELLELSQRSSLAEEASSVSFEFILLIIGITRHLKRFR